MGAASRVALGTATAALAAEKSVSFATGDALLAAQRTIEATPQLRSVLADPAIEGAEKSALIGKLFGALDPAAASLLAEIAGSRWSSSDELLDGIEEIAFAAFARTAGTADLTGELLAFARTVASDHSLELAVGSKLGDPAAKAALVGTLLAGSAAPETVAIASHLVRSPRGRRIGASLAAAAETIAAASSARIAIVTAAAPLNATQQKALAASLAAQYGSEIRIDLRVDPAVLGGLRVQVGDEVVDGTIAARLADLKLRLAG